MVQAWGTIDPDAYRDTPWTGTSLGLGSPVLFLMLCAVLFARWRAGRLAAAAETQAGHVRTAGVAARARASSPTVD